MPVVNWNVVLVGLLYAALTGIFNFAFAHKSQVESWVNENPRLAAILKFTRAAGFDPWNIISAALLLFKKRLPDAQQNGAKAVAQFKAASVRPMPLDDTESTPPWSGPSAGGVAALLLICCFAWTQSGCGLLASAAPYLAEAAVVIADGLNDIQLVEELIAKFPGLAPDARAYLEKKLEATQLALQAAAAADNGAKDLTAAQLDASFTAFRAAWFDLTQALTTAGIVKNGKIGLSNGEEFSVPSPIALRPVVVK